MRISELARRSGVSIQTVRFYERKGLLAKPERSPAGYRCYTREDVFAVRNIRALQAVGFTLNDIFELGEYERALAAGNLTPARKSQALSEILARAGARLAILDEHLHELSRKKRHLEDLIEAMNSACVTRGFALPTEIACLHALQPSSNGQCARGAESKILEPLG